MTRDPQDGFLTRWSRRKRGEGEESAEEPLAEPATEPAEAEPEDPRPDAEILAELNLPDPDTLEKGADFSVFMRAAVPERIRRRALRRLWRSNPTLAVLDGLNDYDGDFTGDTVAPGMLKTAYQVGRGFLKETEEDSPLSEAPESPAPQDEPPGQEDAQALGVPAAIPDHIDNNAESETDPASRSDGAAGQGRTRARMAFRFQTDK